MKKSNVTLCLALLGILGLIAVSCEKETNEMLTTGDEIGIEAPMLKTVPENDYWWHHLHEVFYKTQDLINTGTISEAIGKALLVKYDVAWDNLRKGKNEPAIGSLGALTNFVEGLVLAKMITPEIGEELVLVPNAIIESFKHQCGDPIYDVRDGRYYNTVQIGGQCWLSENLEFKTENSHYYNEGAGPNKPVCYDYGLLYNIQDAFIGCPIGWHLPGDEEWKSLEKHLEMTESDANAYDNSSRNSGEVGYKLKSTTGWYSSSRLNGNGDNSSGFNALPGGFGDLITHYYTDKGGYAKFWSSTDMRRLYWFRQLSWSEVGVYRYYRRGDMGYSVRCLKNE